MSRRSTARAAAVGVAALLLVTAASTGAASAPAGGGRSGSAPDVVSVPLSFSVLNTNTSRVPCSSDGEAYTVRGTLVGPRRLLAASRAPAVTVYVPSFGFSDYWRFTAVAGHDHAAAMAAAGHVSLVYDPLGYGASDQPAGMQTCLGAAADVLHQVVAALRAGDYAGDVRPRFRAVVLASHTSGALITQPEAFSYGDVDGLVVTSWADSHFTPYFGQNTLEASAACATGGEPADGDRGPDGYTYIPPPDRFAGTYFVDADDDVVAAAVAGQRRAPCGDFASAGTVNALDQVLLAEVDVPVLLAYGEEEPLFDQPAAGEQQRARFSGAPSVDLAFFPGAGGALALERGPALTSTIATWLCANDLAARRACASDRDAAHASGGRAGVRLP